MVYDPIKKREYDKKRNAKLKAEYLAKNPNYKSTRTSKYDYEDKNIQQGTGFNEILNDYYKKPTQPLPIKKPVYNPNGIEAKKSAEHYEDEEDDKFLRLNYTPQAYQQIRNGLANIRFY